MRPGDIVARGEQRGKKRARNDGERNENGQRKEKEQALRDVLGAARGKTALAKKVEARKAVTMLRKKRWLLCVECREEAERE